VLRIGAAGRGRRHGLSDLFAAGCPVHKEALRAPCACRKLGQLHPISQPLRYSAERGAMLRLCLPGDKKGTEK